MKNISFQHEHLDHYDGQDNYELGIYEDDEVMGYVQYVIYNNEITVSDILVRPNRRREGFGSMLIKKMKQLHPESTYKPSLKTDLGAKFIHKDVELNETDENLTQTDNFKNWFKESKVVDTNGKPLILFHQTNKDNEESIKNLGFEHGRGRAILSDNGVPNGFFFKPTDKDIGLGNDSTQIPVYLSLQNPLIADSRRDLLLKVSQIDPNIHELDYQYYLKDKEYQKKFDSLWNELKTNRETYKIRGVELEEILQEWETWVKQTSGEMRNLITDALIKGGYDGVILKNDIGSFGRNTISYIALYPEQIKSIHNQGSFNPKEKSIMKERELNEEVNRIKKLINLL